MTSKEALKGIEELLPNLDKPYIKIIEKDLKDYTKLKKEYNLLVDEKMFLIRERLEKQKALETIKELLGLKVKEVELFGVVAEYFLCFGFDIISISKEQYNLLKGWLE